MSGAEQSLLWLVAGRVATRALVKIANRDEPDLQGQILWAREHSVAAAQEAVALAVSRTARALTLHQNAVNGMPEQSLANMIGNNLSEHSRLMP